MTDSRTLFGIITGLLVVVTSAAIATAQSASPSLPSEDQHAKRTE